MTLIKKLVFKKLFPIEKGLSICQEHLLSNQVVGPQFMMNRVDEGKIKQYLSKTQHPAPSRLFITECGNPHFTKAYLQYQNPDLTRRDVVSSLNLYPGLICKLEPFVFNDGRQMDLLNMGGTIPVNFKVFSNGAKKKLAQLVGIIPVTFKGNVYNIPVCIWLMDTHPNNAPMCYVKPTPDMQIKASMFVDQSGKIYLPYLHEWSPSSSDLLGLIQIMIVTFSDQPPVYARSRTNIAATTPYPTQSYMPVPANSGPSSGNPPYPTTYHNYPSYPAANSSGFPPYPTNFYNYGSAGYPQYPPYPQTSQPNTSSPQNNSQTGTITEEHIRASLLSAVEDKLRRKMVEKLSQGQAELDTLNRTQRELTQGKHKLDDILARLEKEQIELDKNITILRDKEEELEKAISHLSEQEPIDVDEAVTTTTPLYKQLLAAFAEEAATEDAIYYMGEALRRGVIDLDVFLKQVRTLSRKQFMLRALMFKCRQKAGLAG